MAQFRKDTNQYLPQEKTIFEVVMLADQFGGVVGPANPSGMAVDAFGRARVSTPLTLFDSSHRYRDNGLWAQSNTNNTTITFSPNEGLMNLAISTANNDEIIRETTKVFSYQPGKSLQILSTFVMSPPKANLRQRVGYFGANNGIYLEQDGTNIYFVERSYNSGSVSETRVAQADWNIDALNGSNTGTLPDGTPTLNRNPSGMTLDLTKAQIFFSDIEWLGLGTVRCGFVIDGRLIHCHSFHHANYITSTYMTTASLPLRYEIKNIGTTTSNSLLKQVCSSVISEGGYELRGEQKTAGMDTPTSNNYTLTSLNTYYPVCSIRLKSDRLDAVVIPKNISLVGTTASDYRYKIIVGASITGGNWVSAGSDSSVEFNINATSQSGGKELFSSYLISTGGQSLTAKLEDGLFRYQLERNGLTSTPTTFTLVVAAKANGDKVLASIDWEEVSR
jgi:hypothetical protein